MKNKKKKGSQRSGNQKNKTSIVNKNNTKLKKRGRIKMKLNEKGKKEEDR